MSLIASALKHMLAAGMPHEAIIAAVEEMEATLKPEKSARVARNARYYEANREDLRLKASERRLNRLNATETSELGNGASSPIPKETLPHTPSKEITLTPAITNNDERARTPSPRASRLPANWQPSSDETQFAESQGLSSAAIQHEAEKYRDYWAAKAGAGGAKLDWPATWRNWIRKAIADGATYDQRNRQTAGSANRGGPREDSFITAARREIDGIRGGGWDGIPPRNANYR